MCSTHIQYNCNVKQLQDSYLEANNITALSCKNEVLREAKMSEAKTSSMAITTICRVVSFIHRDLPTLQTELPFVSH